MARIDERKAAKEYVCGRCGIAIGKGDRYRTWKLRHGARQYRCTASTCDRRPEETTGSPFLQQAYGLQADLEKIQLEAGAVAADFSEDLQGIADSLEEMATEAEGSLDNMPDGLKEGDTGQLLQQRVDQCRELASDCQKVVEEIQQAAEALESALGRLSELQIDVG